MQKSVPVMFWKKPGGQRIGSPETEPKNLENNQALGRSDLHIYQTLFFFLDRYNDLPVPSGQ